MGTLDLMTHGPTPKVVAALRAAEELQDARVLLDRGAKTLETMSLGRGDGVVVATLLASGTEKLLKMTYGLMLTATSGSWPGETVRSYGHGVARLDGACRHELATRLPASGSYVGDLLAEVDADPVIPPLLRLLSSYATRGRFANLDHLGGMQNPEPPPSRLWRELDDAAAERHSHLFRLGNVEEMQAQLIAARNADLCASFRSWRTLYWRAWQHGLCGPDAKQASSELRPE